MRMPRIGILILVLMASTPAWNGCGQAPGENEAIRSAIQVHLASRSDLNPTAFETELQGVTIRGNEAEANVVYRVKGGPGMMQLTYTLRRNGGKWGVVRSNPVGSNFTHPLLDGTASGPPAPPPDIFDAVRQRMRVAPPSATPGSGQPREN